MDIYEEWLDAKHNLNCYKKEELRLRNEIIESKIKEQTQGNYKFIEGNFKLTIGLGIRNVIDEAELDTIYNDLPEDQKYAVKYKPSLVAKEFNKLNGTELLFSAITQKPSQATLKIEVNE